MKPKNDLLKILNNQKTGHKAGFFIANFPKGYL